MALTHYACTHCGGWTLWFVHERPPICRVCMDVRNALPEDGFVFLSDEEAGDGRRSTCRRIADGLSVVRETPPLGLGSAGWLIDHEKGTVAIEAAGWYDRELLADLSGITMIAATHPHGYGALHQLQHASGADIAVHVQDLEHTKAFRVRRPLGGERGELLPGLVWTRLGGHYAGQTAYYDEDRARVFLGDAVKVGYDGSGQAESLSAHKGFHYDIPLTAEEIDGYTAALSPLPFAHVATTFDHAEGLSREMVLAFFDRLKSDGPHTDVIPLRSL